MASGGFASGQPQRFLRRYDLVDGQQRFHRRASHPERLCQFGQALLGLYPQGPRPDEISAPGAGSAAATGAQDGGIQDLKMAARTGSTTKSAIEPHMTIAGRN